MNEKEKKALEEKQRREHEIRIKELRALLQDRTFRRHTWRQINLCGVYRMSWDPSARIHFNEGMRFVGLDILQDVNEADPTVEGLMRKEALEDERNG
jgi:hypothetical protein